MRRCRLSPEDVPEDVLPELPAVRRHVAAAVRQGDRAGTQTTTNDTNNNNNDNDHALLSLSLSLLSSALAVQGQQRKS